MLPPEKITALLKLEGLIEELERRTDFESRVHITLQAIENTLPIEVKCEQKDAEESIRLRKQADDIFFKHKGRVSAFMQALKLYSESIAKAKQSSTALAQAYANRSAVLFNLHKREECVNDINRALELSYPDHLKANLLCRKAKCLKILDKAEADKVCEEARNWLENMTLSDEKKEKLEMKINKATKIASKKIDNGESNELILPLFTAHKNIPSVSSAIDIKYNRDFGRHLVANRDIDVGEIIIDEKPYAVLLNSDNIYTHCSHCLIRTWDSIPCEYCVFAMYCSEKCKNEAWKQYHDVECPIKGYFLAMHMNGIAPFSLKLTTLATREAGGIDKLWKELKEVDNCKDYLLKSFSKEGIYCSDKYKPLYSLLTHENDRKRYEILALSLNAALTLYFLFTFTSFFGETADKKVSTLYKNPEAMFIGKLIAHNYMIIQMNDHEVSELHVDEFVRIGSIIAPVTSLLNHSCNANAGRCSILKNNTVQEVFYALQPIRKGSQILNDYGVNFAFTPKAERESFCTNYFFKCHCIACDNMWPLLEDLPSILRIVTNKEKQVEISRALVRSKGHQRTIFNIGLDKYPGNVEDILACLANSVAILSQNTDKPSKEYSELLELFRQSFAQIYANKFKLAGILCL